MKNLKHAALALFLSATGLLASSARADQFSSVALAWNGSGFYAWGSGYTVDQAEQNALQSCVGCTIASVIEPTSQAFIVLTGQKGTGHLWATRNENKQTAISESMNGCTQAYGLHCEILGLQENADLSAQ